MEQNIKPVSGYKNLVLLVYKITDKFPKSEEFALKNQIRRAVVSILSQIAEGWLRRSKKDKFDNLRARVSYLLYKYTSKIKEN